MQSAAAEPGCRRCCLSFGSKVNTHRYVSLRVHGYSVQALFSLDRFNVHVTTGTKTIAITNLMRDCRKKCGNDASSSRNFGDFFKPRTNSFVLMSAAHGARRIWSMTITTESSNNIVSYEFLSIRWIRGYV